MSDVVNYESGDVKKLFFKYAIPSIFGMLIVSIQMMVDGMGRKVGTLGLAAVNLSMPFMEFIISIALMIIIGGVVITGIAKGNKNEALAKGYTSLTLVLYLTTLSSIAIIGTLNFDSICSFLGVNEDVYPYVKAYLSTMLILCPFFCIPNFTEAFSRLAGRPNLVFVSGLICFGVNVALDYLFIMKLGWGMQGAAIATCIANFSGAIALSPFVKLGRIKGSLKEIKSIYFNGSSEMLISMSAAFSTYLFNLMLMKYVGNVGVAALTIIFYINMIVNMSLFGLSQAIQPIIAYNVGAKDIVKIKEVLKTALIFGGAIGLLCFIIMNIFSVDIITIFAGADKRLLEITKVASAYITIQYLFSFVNIITSSFHTAIEKPLQSASIALCRSLIFIAIPLYFLPMILGEVGIWISLPLAEVLSLFISIPLILSSFKSLKKSFTV